MEDNTTRKTFPQQIAARIEEKITSGEYQVGDRLPTEPQLSAIFGVSRGSIREAIKALVSAGLLESRQGAGTYVKARERLQIEIYRTLDTSNEKNIREIQNMLEKHIALLAARNRKREDLKRMRSRLDMRNEAKSSQEDFYFHLSVAEATHNDILKSAYRYITEYLQESYDTDKASSLEEGEMTELHERLYSAIEQQDDRMAESIISRIIEA